MSKTISYVVGAVMTIAGIWGWMSSPVLGIFDANTALSVLWLVAGLVLLAVAMWSEGHLSLVQKIYGVVLAVLAVWGFIVPGDLLGMFTNTTADNVLHLVLAIALLYSGFMGGKSSSSMPMM